LDICKTALPKTDRRYIGYPAGGRPNCLIHHNDEVWFWQEKVRPKGKPERYLNWFGVYQNDHKSLNITLEVNAYCEGKSRRISGFFAKDPVSEDIFLMHNGGIGGGKPGQNKYAFLAWRGTGSLVDVVSSDGNTEKAIAVMAISKKASLTPALAYINEVREYKKLLDESGLEEITHSEKVDQLKAYFKEGAGRRVGKRSSDIDYISYHGHVVDALKAWRNSSGIPNKCSLKKSVFVDLAVSSARKILELYEVKTSARRQDIYTAIGQLMVHDRKGKSLKFLVIPDGKEFAEDLRQTLVRLEIIVIRYKQNKLNFTFEKRLG